MESYLLEHEEEILSVSFYGVIIVMALWEVMALRRNLSHKTWVRWPSNIALGLVDIVVVRWAVPVAGLGLAFLAEQGGWGLLNQLSLPYWLSVLAALLARDLMHYGVHRLMHAVPILWRLHLVHHADLDVDFTTGYRHHPFEALVISSVYMLTIVLLGVPPAAAVLFGALGNVISIYTHGNVRTRGWVDRLLRSVVMTPDVHIVHHSAARRETDSNFGLVLTWWDRLFGTYCARPAAGYQAMTLGLEHFRDPRDLRLDRMLVMPFLKSTETVRPPARAVEAGGSDHPSAAQS